MSEQYCLFDGERAAEGVGLHKETDCHTSDTVTGSQ